MQRLLRQLHLALWTTLVLTLGYLLGSFLLAMESVSAPAPVRVLPRSPRRAPFVYLQEIRHGKIVGVVGTGARLVIGNTVIVPKPDRTFELPAGSFLVNTIDVPIPRGAEFVASKRGKNYYPIASRSAERLKPENRLYFRSAEEAEALGYEPGK